MWRGSKCNYKIQISENQSTHYNILDLHLGYLLSSFGQTTASRLATLVNGEIGHNRIACLLFSKIGYGETGQTAGAPN